MADLSELGSLINHHFKAAKRAIGLEMQIENCASKAGRTGWEVYDGDKDSLFLCGRRRPSTGPLGIVCI